MKQAVGMGIFGRAVLLAALLCPSLPAWAMECPDPHNVASAGIIKEPAKEIAAAANALHDDDVDNKIGVIVDDLVRKYPHADPTELVNFLATAYCPIVDREDLTERAKRARMDHFSKQAFDLIEKSEARQK